ncbi:MAG: phenylacetate--CoA ligase family protein, partial [Flavobacterium sp.]|nr:phenylacetate--CoA ligase family protein [Flavobacterium sp.]
DPFDFAKDKFCHALVWSSIYHRFGWYDLDLNKAYQARFYGYPLEFLNKYKVKLKDFLSNRYRFPIFDLSDKSLKDFVATFELKKFHYINGYTSSIVMLAKYLEKENIVLKTICPTLKVCIVTSEMLFEEDKILLERQLGVPVVNEYGASELDIIAFQNVHDEWLINNENLFIEILDDQNNPLPFGQEGNIVVTALFNKAHPFIRYKIGDVGVIEKKSSKKIILKKLTGRTNDFAFLPSGKKAPGMTFYSITKTVMEEDGNLKEFVITQTEKNTFEIEYVSEIPLSEERILYFEKKLTDYLEEGLTYVFIRKEKLERSKSGKLKQFKSLVNQNL